MRAAAGGSDREGGTLRTIATLGMAALAAGGTRNE